MAGSFPLVSSYGIPRTSAELYRLQTNSRLTDNESYSTADCPQSGGTYGLKEPPKKHRKLVFTDPVAFRYLEEDESTMVLAKRHKLEGYELYVIEQWICSRTHPTFTICTYTGDTSRSILVNVLAVPEDQSTWSKRLKVYFDGISQSYAREREIHLGTLMVTNLSGFPSSLNVIPVPDGDVRKHREDFIVNENLKRMGCAGRAAMSLHYPQASTVTKFHHMFRTSEKIPVYSSVIELVRFCQIALVIYGKLDTIYADGLLCDITEKAINEWWNEIGLDFHNVEPNDGIFGPTTVSALLGLLMGAYNRLKETGAPTGKDPMDLSSMKRAIAHFQKVNRIDRTRRLDRATLDRLHRVTASKAEDEGLTVTRALKSTVAGLSGKGGEMIARGFGGKEKLGITEVETLDIEQLAQSVTGRSMKWLWQGKDRGSSNGAAPPPDELNGKVFSIDDQGNFIWTSRERQEDEDGFEFISAADPEEPERRGHKIKPGPDHHIRKHRPKHHRSNTMESETSHGPTLGVPINTKEPHSERSSRSPSRERFIGLAGALAEQPVNRKDTVRNRLVENRPETTRGRSDTAQNGHRRALRGVDHQESPVKRKVAAQLSQIRNELRESRYSDFRGPFDRRIPEAKALRRSSSAVYLRPVQVERAARLGRHLSFSLLTEALESDKVTNHESEQQEGDETEVAIPARVQTTRHDIVEARSAGMKLMALERGLAGFVDDRVAQVEYIKNEAAGQLEELNNMYYQHLDEYQTLQATSTDLVAHEKAGLNEAMRSIDMIGQKIDYEVDSLVSRLQEVEESVDDFERRVLDVEASVKSLISQEENDLVLAWYERWLPWSKSRSAAKGPGKQDGKRPDGGQDKSQVEASLETPDAKMSVGAFIE